MIVLGGSTSVLGYLTSGLKSWRSLSGCGCCFCKFYSLLFKINAIVTSTFSIRLLISTMTFFMPRVGGRALFIFPLHRAWSQLCGSLHEYAWNQIWHCPSPINNLVIWLELQKAPVHGLQNKRSPKTNKRKRPSFHASLWFHWGWVFQHLGILLRVARGRVEGGEMSRAESEWPGLLAAWGTGCNGMRSDPVDRHGG